MHIPMWMFVGACSQVSVITLLRTLSAMRIRFVRIIFELNTRIQYVDHLISDPDPDPYGLWSNNIKYHNNAH